jgi:hypothetical protein
MKTEKIKIVYNTNKSIVTPEKTMEKRRKKKECPSCDMRAELARATISESSDLKECNI